MVLDAGCKPAVKARDQDILFLPGARQVAARRLRSRLVEGDRWPRLDAAHCYIASCRSDCLSLQIFQQQLLRDKVAPMKDQQVLYLLKMITPSIVPNATRSTFLPMCCNMCRDDSSLD
jgi:hypothetical protein